MQNDFLSINGEDIPEIDAELDALLQLGRKKRVNVLDGSAERIFGDRKPYARTHVRLVFRDDEETELRNCVRLLRWSDDRLRALGSSIEWSWETTLREGMEIQFSVAWYDRSFFERRRNAFADKNHLSYFSLFGKGAKDMSVNTEVLG